MDAIVSAWVLAIGGPEVIFLILSLQFFMVIVIFFYKLITWGMITEIPDDIKPYIQKIITFMYVNNVNEIEVEENGVTFKASYQATE